MKIPGSHHMLKYDKWDQTSGVPPDDSSENLCFGVQKRGVK